MNRVRKREQAQRTPNAAAQWPSAWDFAKRLECVRLAGVFQSSWSQWMRQSERKLSMNRPTPDPSQEGGQTFVRCAKVPLLGGVTGGFMLPMHARERKEPLAERARPLPPEKAFGQRVQFRSKL